MVWIKTNSIVGNTGVIYLNATDAIVYVGTTLTSAGFAGGTLYVDGVAGTTVSTDWHLVGVTVNTGKNASALDICKVNTIYNAGYVGEIMLYDKELTSSEVLSLYNQTKWRYINT